MTKRFRVAGYSWALATLGSLYATHAAHAATYVEPTVDRSKVQLNGSWKFIASDTLTGAEATSFADSSWSTVTVPHTWDSIYSVTKRSHSWYRTHFTIPTSDSGKRISVYFEGAFQVANVFVNGHSLGQHRGGFTRFTFDATSSINFGGDNVLAVMVSNADCSDCLPDVSPTFFKGYGGIYRKAWLVKTNKYHAATSHFASNGVYITPSNVGTSSVSVSVKTLVTNDGSASKTFTVKNFLTDASETILLSLQTDVSVAPGATVSVTQTGSLASPQLWSTSNPVLYKVHANVWVDGAIADSVTERTGFRSFKLTSSDFTLNGVSTRLRGVSKHQENEYNASAMTDAELTQDWDNLQDLGVNYVRLVHYPHAELEYTLADQRGIMVWAENGHTGSGAATTNGNTINQEMVYQNWNHPSIIFWSAGNEAPGVAATSQYATIIRAADGSRPVTYASSGQNPSNLDFLFKNTYAGWYGGTMYDFITAPDHWISETGAGMAIGTHTADSFAMNHTVNSFEPEEYGALVNEVRFNDLFGNPSHVPAFSNWVFRELSDGKYKGLVNTKGILTFSNYKKDVYYLLKAFLRASPVIHVVAPHYFLRGANGQGQGDVKVYANAPAMTLTVNGVSKGSKSDGSYRHPNGTVIRKAFYWTNALSLGRNVVVASDGNGNSDTAIIYYRGTGQTMPAESGAKIKNLTSSNSAAFFINTPVADQRPFYCDFDGSGDNTFDVLPSAVVGASWITTRRQSDSTKRTNLAFDMNSAGDVYVMATKQSATPSWISAAGLVDTGASGKWRDNNLRLVDFKLYKKTFSAGAHVSLASSAIDYVVLVK